MGNKTYSISEISKLSNLSQKQLRYYEDRELISKVQRNIENNYRYYTQEHVRQLFIIREYRLLGYSLDEIYHLLHESSISTLKNSIRRGLRNAREKMEIAILEYEKNAEKFTQIMEAVSILEARLMINEGTNSIENYEAVDYPAKDVVAISHEGTFFDVDKISQKHLAYLYVIKDEYNLTSIGPLIFKFYNPFLGEMDEFNIERQQIEICFPVVEKKSECTYCKTLKGFKGISTIYIGDYDSSMVNAYKRLKDWGNKQGYKLLNSSVEEYLIGSELTSRKELWVTRIIIPIAD